MCALLQCFCTYTSRDAEVRFSLVLQGICLNGEPELNIRESRGRTVNWTCRTAYFFLAIKSDEKRLVELQWGLCMVGECVGSSHRWRIALMTSFLMMQPIAGVGGPVGIFSAKTFWNVLMRTDHFWSTSKSFSLLLTKSVWMCSNLPLEPQTLNWTYPQEQEPDWTKPES